jgi:hypothetical protein
MLGQIGGGDFAKDAFLGLARFRGGPYEQGPDWLIHGAPPSWRAENRVPIR